MTEGEGILSTVEDDSGVNIEQIALSDGQEALLLIKRFMLQRPAKPRNCLLYKVGGLTIGVRVGQKDLPETLKRVKLVLALYDGRQPECAWKILAELRENSVIKLIDTNN